MTSRSFYVGHNAFGNLIKLPRFWRGCQTPFHIKFYLESQSGYAMVLDITKTSGDEQLEISAIVSEETPY